MSDSVNVETPIPLVLSIVSLWRDILLGKSDGKLLPCRGSHDVSEIQRESCRNTERQLPCWKGFSKGKPCKLGLHGYAGVKKKEKGEDGEGQSWRKASYVQSYIREMSLEVGKQWGGVEV